MTPQDNERNLKAAQEYVKAMSELTDAITMANIKKLETITALAKETTRIIKQLEH